MNQNIDAGQILAAITASDSKTETKFSELKEAIKGLDKKFDGLDKKVDEKFEALDQKIDQNFIDLHTNMSDFATHTDGQFTEIKERLTTVENTMVTKDHLDKKIGSLSGELVELTRKEDAKLTTLVDVLHDRKAITKEDVKKVVTMEPFAKLL